MYATDAPHAAFFDSESDNVAMLTNYYNQLNRFPFLPLSSSLTSMPAAHQSAGYVPAPFSVDELNRNFAVHPGMPNRRMSFSSTCSTDSSSEFCLPASLYIDPATYPDVELSPSPTATDIDCGPTSTSPLSSHGPSTPLHTPLNSPTHSISMAAELGNSMAKKTRAPPRERISTKDFKPPDVTGLTKREARLVKNRAAAFLSRQRKREEFEVMEIRVTELEKENARLLNELSGSGKDVAFIKDHTLQSEISTMRSKLASSEQRAAELREELAHMRQMPSPISPSLPRFGHSTSVKKEPFDLTFDRSPSPSNSDSSGSSDKDRNAARLGLLVLMSLSTLFSNAASGSSTSKFTLSTDSLPPLSSFAPASQPEWEYNFSGDDRLKQQISSDAEFDVSFTTSPEDGKIRVRLSVPSSPTPTADSLASSAFPWEQPMASPSPPLSDSFFSFDLPQSQAFPFDTQFGQRSSTLPFPVGKTGSAKKRLRISLKNSGESNGGEWDVEVC